MKKIMHLLSSNAFSGAENIAIKIIKETKNEYRSIYCSPIGKIEYNLKKNNIENIMLDNFSYNQVKRVVDKYKPDIIHAHDFKASLLASLFHKKAKIISHIHQSPNWSKNFNLKSIIFMLSTKSIDKIIYVSNDAKDRYYFAKKIKNKTTVIYNAIDTNELIRKSKAFNTNSYDFIYIGRLTDVKNPFDFINIVKEIPNSKSIMIGDGDLFDKVQKFLIENSLQNKITLMGYNENPYPYLKNSKICIIPSKSEGFSLTAIEAGALGVPVVANNTFGLREIVKKINGITYSKEKDASRKILNLINDNSKYIFISKMERKKVNNNFDILNLKDSFLNLYKSL